MQNLFKWIDVRANRQKVTMVIGKFVVVGGLAVSAVLFAAIVFR